MQATNPGKGPEGGLPSPRAERFAGAPAGGASWVSWGLLALACGLGLLVFVRLGTWSLWIDEVFTYSDSLNENPTDNPVGYVVFGWFYQLLGESGGAPSEWSLRILPAILGWLGIPLTFWAFRRWVGDHVAAGAALLLAVSSWHLYWSQNARFYTLVQDLVLIASGCGLRALFPAATSSMGRRIGWLVGALVAFAVAALGHPTAAIGAGAFVVAPLVLGWAPLPAAFARGPLGRDLFGKLLMAVVALGAVVALVWVRPILELWSSNKGGGTPAHLVLTTGFFVTPLVGAACLLATWDAWRRRHLPGLFAFVFLAAGLGVALGVSFFVRVTAQYLFALLPWVCVLAAMPLASGRTEDAYGKPRPVASRPLAWGVLALLALTGLTSCGLYLSVRAGERPHWREAYRFVWNQRAENDQIFGMAGEVAQFYLDPETENLREIDAVSYLNKWRVRATERWAREDRRAWYVVNREELFDWADADRQAFEAMLAADCRLVRKWPLYVESRDLSVEVYLRE